MTTEPTVDNTVAHTSLGALQGEASGGVIRFRAVPYAAPPVGPLRFAAPAPPASWTGVRNVRNPGPIAPQPASRLRAAMGDFTRPQDEDCLTLAITTPALDDARRPVVVWLHGGAYLSGAGSLDWYDGTRLATAGDIVVVGVNYRLGPLGFLHYPGLADGIMGLRDQIAALRFVQEEIAAFGGDPAQVTLMGQSAGGGSALRLLAMPQTAGLFHRLIVQSGAPRPGPSAAEATQRAWRLMDLLGIDPDSAEAGSALRAAPTSELIAGQSVMARELAQFGVTDPAFPPTFDDYTPDYTERLARAAAERGVAMVIGTTREEMNAFFVADPAMAQPDPVDVAQRFAALAGDAETIETYRAHRPGGTLRDLMGDLVTDHRFLLPSLDLAQRVAAAGGLAFVYQFDAGDSPDWKACHCIELPFTFGTFAAWNAPMLRGFDQAFSEALSATMVAAWCTFIRTGAPSTAPLPWPPYDGTERLTMVFSAVTGVAGDPGGVRWKTAPAQ
jgi:para-nitrobenzyl esterase